MGIDPQKIKADYTFLSEESGKWELYFSLLRTTLSAVLKDFSNEEEILRALPIIKADSLKTAKNTFSVYLLGHAQYTQGCGRFVTDTLNTFLVPGSYTPVLLSRSARLIFEDQKKTPLIFIEYLLEMPEGSNKELLKINLPRVLRVLRLSILSARYARSFVQKKTISEVEEALLLQENIQDLFELSENSAKSQFISHIPKRFMQNDRLTHTAPHVSLVSKNYPIGRRSIFLEMHRFLALIPTHLQSKIPQRICIRILAFAYLFRKVVSMASTNDILPPYLFKVFPHSSPPKDTTKLGLLFTFSEPYLVAPISVHTLWRYCKKAIPSLVKSEDEWTVDKREDSTCCTFFIELSKETNLAFTKNEKAVLRTTLETSLPELFCGPSCKVQVDQPTQTNTSLDEVTRRIVESGRYNEELLHTYIEALTLKHILEPGVVDGVTRCYYMLYALLHENEEKLGLHISVQTMENMFLIAAVADTKMVYTKLKYLFKKYEKKDEAITSLFFIQNARQCAALFCRFTTTHSIQSLRQQLLIEVEHMQLEVEALVESM